MSFAFFLNCLITELANKQELKVDFKKEKRKRKKLLFFHFENFILLFHSQDKTIF